MNIKYSIRNKEYNKLIRHSLIVAIVLMATLGITDANKGAMLKGVSSITSMKVSKLAEVCKSIG